MATNPYDYLMGDWGAWSPTIPPAQGGMFPEGDVVFGPGEQVTMPANWTLPSFNFPTDNEEDLDPGNIDYWISNAGEGAMNWISVLGPLAQLMQNSEQFRSEFNEAQRRFDQQFGWTRARDQYQMDLSTRQQNAEEQQAAWQQSNMIRQLDETELNNVTARDVAQRQMSLAELQQQVQSGQWERSFAAQQVNDEHARALADQRLAFEQAQSDRQLTLEEQQSVWMNEYRQAQIANEEEALRVQERVAQIQSYGRNRAPGGGGVNSQWVSQWG